MWMITGIISILATCIAFFMAFQNDNKKFFMAMIAVSFMALTIFMQYWLVYDWVIKKDLTALMDVVPSIFRILCGYTIIILLLNVVAVSIKPRNK